MGLLSYASHKHSCRFQHISVLTTCTIMFRQVCTIEPSFFKTTSGMHRRPFEGRHLVSVSYTIEIKRLILRSFIILTVQKCDLFTLSIQSNHWEIYCLICTSHKFNASLSNMLRFECSNTVLQTLIHPVLSGLF